MAAGCAMPEFWGGPMRKARLLNTVAVGALLAALAACSMHSTEPGGGTEARTAKSIKDIDTVVVIFAENRSFDNLYGNFPGANGLANASAASKQQLDRDGTVLSELPPIWGGLTAK